MMRKPARAHEVNIPPEFPWEAAMVDACHAVQQPPHATFVRLMISLLDNPGKEALEATYRLGGDCALRHVAIDRCGELWDAES